MVWLGLTTYKWWGFIFVETNVDVGIRVTWMEEEGVRDKESLEWEFIFALIGIEWEGEGCGGA